MLIKCENVKNMQYYTK